MPNKIIAVVGMTGSGKTEVVNIFEKNGFARIRFGDLTEEELRKSGLEINEKNEKFVREQLRKEYGMAAYTLLNKKKIDTTIKKSDVVIDGVYSWEEYEYLKKEYKNFYVVAVYASPKIRYKRLAERKIRALKPGESKKRDFAEIENINKAGPITMADFTIVNEGGLEELKRNVENIINKTK